MAARAGRGEGNDQSPVTVLSKALGQEKQEINSTRTQQRMYGCEKTQTKPLKEQYRHTRLFIFFTCRSKVFGKKLSKPKTTLRHIHTFNRIFHSVPSAF